ncbi:MAG: hypothetical protein A2469_04535 [Candidatus Magasanikbacteria bacterium RIFOXYC2_FULL_40_16]|uniref:Uncharacterized protein n=1 Tax=Candidatus Magasanikbacteria bacterium RIFOXYC2_FULL_40_16 TaxID=1798703 RepID=A0A1F6NZU8_9BACT|nr:MAG: hypothetical protein A2469_04535 [Candidatus Magasanikbacteria bacterium RIFOXYC2_FULL_40_16]
MGILPLTLWLFVTLAPRIFFRKNLGACFFVKKFMLYCFGSHTLLGGHGFREMASENFFRESRWVCLARVCKIFFFKNKNRREKLGDFLCPE